MEVNGANVPIILQNIFLCVAAKERNSTGLQQLEGCFPNSHFWVEYPFKCVRFWVLIRLYTVLFFLIKTKDVHQ